MTFVSLAVVENGGFGADNRFRLMDMQALVPRPVQIVGISVNLGVQTKASLSRQSHSLSSNDNAVLDA